MVCLFIYLRYAGQVHEALTLACQALPPLQALSNEGAPYQRLLGYLLIYAASAGISAGLVVESEQWLQAAIQVGEALADPGLLGQIHATHMIRASLTLENRQAFAYAEQALEWVKAGNTPHLQPVILRVLAIGLARQGKVTESFHTAAALQQLVESRHYRCMVSESYFLISTLYEIQRDREAELQTAQQGWTLCQANSPYFGLDNLEGNLIWANLQLGNFAQARELALGFGARARRSGKQAELLYSLQSLGHAALGLGDEEAAATYLTDALKLAVTINSMVRRVLIRRQLGDLSLRQAAFDQALVHFQDALHCANSVGRFDLQLLAQAGLALTYLRQGQPVLALQTVTAFLTAENAVTPAHADFCFIGLATYDVLAAHQDVQAAAILDQLYHEVQTQAAKIKTRAMRTNFLEKIPEHRTIVALWQEAHGGL